MNKRAIIGAMAGALVAMSGNASAYSALGVTWNDGSPLDFEMKSGELRETTVTTVGDELFGYGQVSNINGSSNFCVNCDLTYVFDSYIVAAVDSNEILFSGGKLKFYVQPGGTYDALTPNSAEGNLGQLFLELDGHADTWTVDDLGAAVGTLYGTFNGSLGGGEAGFGNGLFDVVDGAAAPFLDTNLEADGSDLSFSSSFQPANTPIGPYLLSGTAELFGASKERVPEPASIALMGLGLFGIAGAGIRRRKKS